MNAPPAVWGEATEAPLVPLAYRLPRAAAALGVSERTLWQLSKDGIVPCVHLGGVRLYPVDALRRFLDEQAKAQATANTDAQAVRP